ncbi:protein ENHANCED DISEASE RESISTANCE 4 [Quillaja saponaria]|uniref:Protein ENHANCED DISEASE RESISTANCE 4 n=1 Tax=Quillaja saponaria TaxID=32244 RepID=A0AAD7LJW3_QUISA|nr:protein ENHANCED DISEASE RESISTANCE 4 [Quillaja saponaria]
MTGELTTKVRVVRCPKCRQLLPELAGFDVYKCGGCGTTLQAKKRKDDAVNSKSRSNEGDEDRKFSNSDKIAITSSSRECSLDESSETDQNMYGDCNDEKLGDFSLSNGEKNNGSDKNRVSDCSIEPHEVSNKNCSTEAFHHENEASSSSKVANSVLDTRDVFSLSAGEEELNDGSSSFVGAEVLNDGSLLSQQVKEDADSGNSSLACAKSDFDSYGSDSTCKSSNIGHLEYVKKSISLESSWRPAGESSSPDTPFPSPNEQLQQALGSIHHSFDQVRSRDTLENAKIIAPSSEISGVGETARSTHSYGGSIYSSDGIDHQLSNQHLNHVENSSTAAKTVVSEERPRSDSTCKSSSAEHLEDVTESISHESSQRSAGDSSSPDTSYPSPNEQLQQAQGSIHHSFNRLRSRDALDSVEIVGPDSELSGVGDTFTYAPPRSTHSYDGSIYSSDGIDDQLPNQHLKPVENSYNATKTVVSEERPTSDLTSKSSSAEHPEDVEESNPHESSQRPTGESSLPDTSYPSPNEQVQQAQGSIHHCFNQLKSRDTLDSVDIVAPDSELSGVGEMFTYAPARSTHSYDGSIHSSDGIDDQLPNQHLKPVENSYNAAKTVVSEKRPRSDPTSKSSSAEHPEDVKESNPHESSQRRAGESSSPDTSYPSPNEQVQQAQGSIHHSFNRLKSQDTLDSVEIVAPNSELSGVGETFTYAPARSTHSYDGSIYSSDGIDDQLPNQHLNPVENSYNAAKTIVSEERPRIGPTSKSSSAELLEDVKENISHESSQRPAGESSSPDTSYPSPNEQLQQAQGSIHHSLNRLRSRDTLESVEFVGLDSELSGVGEAFTYAPARSTYSYDGSIYSSDGIDDQLPNQQFCVGNSYNATKTGVSVERPRSDPTSKSSSAEHLEDVKESISHESFWMPAGESSSLNTSYPSPNEQLQQAQGSVRHSFGRLRSIDTLDSVEIVAPDSELCGVGETFTYAPARSSHSYDGSVYSSDGIDDQIPKQHLNLVENSNTAATTIVSEERPGRDKLFVDSMMHRDLKMKQASGNFSSDLSRRKHYVTKHGKQPQDELLKTTCNGLRGWNWMRTEREENSSRMPFYKSGYQDGYENGSPSNQMHDEFQCSSSFHSVDTSEDPEQQKMRLLRMVYALQDQLNKSSCLNGKSNSRTFTGVSSKEKRTLAYHSHEANRGVVSHDLGDHYRRFPGRCNHGENLHQMHKFSRMAFSGEATSSRSQVDHSCFHCCPQDWQCSAQLPPHFLYQNKALGMFHPGQNSYISHSSCPSSPEQYMDSEFPIWGRETKSSDQRHRAYEIKRSLREKQTLVKRHFRPIAGGAPFLTCYKCLKLLQLPADFLLFKRRCHRLKCGACLEVLEFSLQDSSHIVSYTQDSADPPPSEVDDYDELINRNNLFTASHSNHGLHVDPVSCSDYGDSVCRSCSSKGDAVPITSDQHFHGNAYDRSISNGSSGPRTEKDASIPKYLNSKKKSPVERYESDGPSSNISRSEKSSAELNKLPPSKSSPLHRLMGYSSPTEVVKGSGSCGEDAS